MAIHVVNEARRCLHCKKPMCREGCPISTNIPEAIELFRTGHKEEAGEMLYENNPLSVICSLVCDHEKQCEGHCVLGRKGAPVHFSSIENYISDAYLDHLEPEMEPKKGQRVAIIGSGPAGITISVLLARRGYDVTIFESREKIGCRRYQTAASVREVDYAKADGVEFYYGMRPTRITDDGVYYKKVEMDEDGNITSTSEEQFFPCTSVIIAISQGAQNRIVSTTTGLEMSSHGLLATDEHGHTTRDGIFASGDVVLGARTVVEAVKYSKQVAEEMDEYLTKRREATE